MKAKKITTYRLSDKARIFLKAMSDEDSLTQTSVLELLIKEEAKRRKFNWEKLSKEYKDMLCRTE